MKEREREERDQKNNKIIINSRKPKNKTNQRKIKQNQKIKLKGIEKENEGRETIRKRGERDNKQERGEGQQGREEEGFFSSFVFL